MWPTRLRKHWHLARRQQINRAAPSSPRAKSLAQRLTDAADGFPPPLHRRVRCMTYCQTGLMFWFIRKKFVGSYVFLSSTSRLYVAP